MREIVKKGIFILCFFMIHPVFSMEILSEKTVHYPVGTINPQPTYPLVTQVINDPNDVKQFKRYVGLSHFPLLTAHENIDSILAQKKLSLYAREDIKRVSMGEVAYSVPETSFLYTDGISDCIALVMFNPHTQRSCLYHVSKMEIRPNDFGDVTLSTYYLPSIKDFFKDNSRPCPLFILAK